MSESDSSINTQEIKDAHLREMLRLNTQVSDETQKLFSELSENQLPRRPDEKTWNVVSCFRHLAGCHPQSPAFIAGPESHETPRFPEILM